MVQKIDQFGFAVAPRSEQRAVDKLYKLVESEQGLVFRSYSFTDRVVNPDFDPEAEWTADNDYYRKLEHSLRNIRIGMMAKEEYDHLFAREYRIAQQETIWGEEVDALDRRLSFGLGETGASAEGPSENELALAQAVYAEWQVKMHEFGKSGLFTAFMNGAISLTPKTSATGPLTVTVTNPNGTVFEQTFSDGFRPASIAETIED